MKLLCNVAAVLLAVPVFIMMLLAFLAVALYITVKAMACYIWYDKIKPFFNN